MSNVATIHDVVPFIAGKTEPLTGQRLAKIGYKSRGKNAAKFASVAVSVPFVSHDDLNANVSRLLPYIQTMCETAQDGIIRGLYESADGMLKTVTDGDISIDAVIGFMEAESQGSRLTKERIESWFDSALVDPLTVIIADKLGFDEPNDAQMATIGKHVRIYRDVLAMLAGGKTFLDPKQIAGCEKALALLDDDSDDIAQKLRNRLQAMKAKPIEELLDL
jgi:hypothetical protein